MRERQGSLIAEMKGYANYDQNQNRGTDHSRITKFRACDENIEPGQRSTAKTSELERDKKDDLGIFDLAETASVRLLPTLEDLYSSISADMVQIFVFLNRPLQSGSSTGDPHDSTDIFRRAGV